VWDSGGEWWDEREVERGGRQGVRKKWRGGTERKKRGGRLVRGDEGGGWEREQRWEAKKKVGRGVGGDAAGGEVVCGWGGMRGKG